MQYVNITRVLDSSVGTNRVILAASSATEPLVIDDLQAIANPTGETPGSFQGETFRVLQMSIRNTETGIIYNLVRIPLRKRQPLITENLLLALTVKNSFTLAPKHDLGIQLVAGNALTGTNTIGIIGQAVIPSTAAGSTITQNFVTATYSVPPRDAFQNAVLGNGWQTPQGLHNLAFYKDQTGRVHIEGWAQKTDIDSAKNIITVMPLSFGHQFYLEFRLSQLGQPTGTLVGLSGRSFVYNGTSTGAICFTGVSYIPFIQ